MPQNTSYDDANKVINHVEQHVYVSCYSKSTTGKTNNRILLPATSSQIDANVACDPTRPEDKSNSVRSNHGFGTPVVLAQGKDSFSVCASC